MATAARRVEIDFPHRRAGHCGSGALRDLLEFHGLSWTASRSPRGMVFGLGAGSGSPTSSCRRSTRRSTGRAHRGARARHLRAPRHRARPAPDGRPARGMADWLRDELDAGRPTMIWADIQHLEYLRVRLQMTMHDIVVTGYDENEGVAFIADNDRDEIQRCSLESLLGRARNSHAFPAPEPARHLGDALPRAAARPRAGRARRRCAGAWRTCAAAAAGWPSAPGRMGLGDVATFAAGLSGVARALRRQARRGAAGPARLHRQGRDRRRDLPVAACGVSGRCCGADSTIRG